jgi:hypothetical protein
MRTRRSLRNPFGEVRPEGVTAGLRHEARGPREGTSGAPGRPSNVRAVVDSRLAFGEAPLRTNGFT